MGHFHVGFSGRLMVLGFLTVSLPRPIVTGELFFCHEQFPSNTPLLGVFLQTAASLWIAKKNGQHGGAEK